MESRPKKRRLNSSLFKDIDFEKVEAEKVEKKQIDMSFNNHEQTQTVDSFEPIPDADSSPLMDPVKQRVGGDDFIKEQKNNSTNYSIPNNNYNNGDAKEFTIEDPELALMQQNQGEPSSEEKKLEENAIDDSSDMMAELGIDLFEIVVPVAAESYYRINEGKIKDLEKQDKLPEGTIEHVRTINKENANTVKLEKAHKDMILKPLKKLLQAKQVKAKPEYMLLFAVLAVCAMIYIKSRSIKKENDDRVLSWIEGYARAKANNKPKEEVIQEPKVEVMP